jgi:hypothetical protein
MAFNGISGSIVRQASSSTQNSFDASKTSRSEALDRTRRDRR